MIFFLFIFLFSFFQVRLFCFVFIFLAQFSFLFSVFKILSLIFIKKLFFPSSFSKSQHKSGHLFCENARPPYSSAMSVSMTTNKFIAWYVDLTAFDSFIKFSFIN